MTTVKPTVRVNIQLLGSEQRKQTTNMTLGVRYVPLLPLCGSSQYYSVISVSQHPPRTFNSQDEALFDGHSQGLMGNAACKLSPGVPE